MGARFASNLVLDLRDHRSALLDHLAQRVGRFRRQGRRLGQYRRDVESLIVPTLGVARAADGWICLGEAPDDGLAVEHLSRDARVTPLDLGISPHAIARLVQRVTGTDGDVVVERLRALFRGLLRLERRYESRRTRADLEARLPIADLVWAAQRRRRRWHVTTCLSIGGLDAAEVRPLRAEAERAMALECSKRRGHRTGAERDRDAARPH
jgi:hypothetical protein